MHIHQNIELHTQIQKVLVSYCAFIDYSKAFDTLNHVALLSKLRKIGISSQVIDWCESYLTNRKQCVKNGDTVSKELNVMCGVPQGSILGPLFFIFYVNDLLFLFGEDDPSIMLYADDTVIYVSEKNACTACDRLERGLAKLHRWCTLNKLSINIKKTKLLIVDPLEIGEDYPYPKLNGQRLK